jgi:hypothetical protein
MEVRISHWRWTTGGMGITEWTYQVGFMTRRSRVGIPPRHKGSVPNAMRPMRGNVAPVFGIGEVMISLQRR